MKALSCIKELFLIFRKSDHSNTQLLVEVALSTQAKLHARECTQSTPQNTPPRKHI